MQLEVRTVNVDIAEFLQAYVESRLRFALGRFGERVGFVSATISRYNHGEVSCRITARIAPFGRVDVRETDPDLFTAIDCAIARTGRLFGHELKRLREARTTRESIRLAA